jgi:hypothetical protein
MRWMFNGVDCRTTWFIEEVDQASLFGVDSNLLPWLESYVRVGLRIYFDDVPYRVRFNPQMHRLLGPYEVIPTSGIDSQRTVVSDGGQAVVYHEPAAQDGPWFNRSAIRHFDGVSTAISQDAAQYNYFPYRFAVRRADGFGEQFVAHTADCRGFCNA